jgi:hypothetical protein
VWSGKQFISLLWTHNVLVTSRDLFEICSDIWIFNEIGEYVVYIPAVDIYSVFQKYM